MEQVITDDHKSKMTETRQNNVFVNAPRPVWSQCMALQPGTRTRGKVLHDKIPSRGHLSRLFCERCKLMHVKLSSLARATYWCVEDAFKPLTHTVEKLSRLLHALSPNSLHYPVLFTLLSGHISQNKISQVHQTLHRSDNLAFLQLEVGSPSQIGSQDLSCSLGGDFFLFRSPSLSAFLLHYFFVYLALPFSTLLSHLFSSVCLLPLFFSSYPLHCRSWSSKPQYPSIARASSPYASYLQIHILVKSDISQRLQNSMYEQL